ncbi:MAG TPA: hypothetical protein VJS65_02410, partial [Verrucomicrobiae bacterium]|nr:hypothetical protein [Verrucomicrobiae bacterium]
DTRSFFASGGEILPAAHALGQLTGPVRLSATLSESVLTLSWPYSGAAMSLVAATNLGPGVSWQPVGGVVQTTGGVFSIVLPATGSHSRFYRLESK